MACKILLDIKYLGVYILNLLILPHSLRKTRPVNTIHFVTWSPKKLYYIHMAKTKEQKVKEEKRFHQELIDQLLKLSTSGFGLVAALAWNDVIKNIIDNYIRPLFGKDSGLASQILYALIITVLAVAVTYNLTRLIKKR